MEPAAIESLKREWTGRRVEAIGSSPTLRRFAGRAGTVVTVNMNGRALVQFDGGVDITWYDLPLEDLRTVISQTPARPVVARHMERPAAAEPPPASPPPPVADGSSRPSTAEILKLARQQGAAKQ